MKLSGLLQELKDGVRAVAQQVKLLPTMQASYMGIVLCPGGSTSSPAP